MLADDLGIEMDDGEIAAFLERHGIGTLAFGDERGSYAIPMSFGYDRDTHRCLFQFALGQDSTKVTYMDDRTVTTLSVHQWHGPNDWQSVIARGTLESVSESDRDDVASVFARNATIPSLETFYSLDEIDMEWYALDIDHVRGIQTFSG